MSEGRMCERHERYCADGVCPYCEPPKKMGDQLVCTEAWVDEKGCEKEVVTLVGTTKPPTPDRPVKLGPTFLDVTSRFARPTSCAPHAGDHTVECYDPKRYAHCQCGEFMFDRLCLPAGYPMEGFGGGKFHTPENCTPLNRCACGNTADRKLCHTQKQCTPLFVTCKCGAYNFRCRSDGAVPQEMDDSGILHTPQRCAQEAFVTKMSGPVPVTLGDLAKVWGDFEKEWRKFGLLEDRPYGAIAKPSDFGKVPDKRDEPPRKLTATEVMQQKALQHQVAWDNDRIFIGMDMAKEPDLTTMVLSPEEQRLVKAYREAVAEGVLRFRWEIPWDAKYKHRR